MIHPIVVEIFHSKRPNINLMVALEEKSGDHRPTDRLPLPLNKIEKKENISDEINIIQRSYRPSFAGTGIQKMCF